MLIEIAWSPALKLICVSSASFSSHHVGRANRLPKGGIDPGSSPVKSATSSRAAKRSLRIPSSLRIFLLAKRRSAGITNITKRSSALHTSALAPLASATPRTRAASWLV